MRTPAQIAGHPIHPMLVTLPIGMWVFSLVADLVAPRAASPDTWHAAALYTLIGGIIGALAAAVPGLIDLLSLREPAIRGTAIRHMSINLTVVVLYVVNAWLRVQSAAPYGVTLGLSILAIAMLLVSGWLGGKMVYEAGVAVHAPDMTDTAQSAASATDAAAEGAAPWSGSRTSAPRTGTASGAGGMFAGNRAMAQDSDGPSRPTGDRGAQ